MDLALGILTGLIIAATPLIFAGLGELIVEKSGVLNLGVEGMMAIGAVSAFAIKLSTGSYLAALAGVLVIGAMMALIFGFLTQVLLANQVATGLALTLFGLGVSALVGNGWSGKTSGQFPRLVDNLDVLAVASLAAAVATGWFLTRTRAGLVLRSVGENHDAAHALGTPVVRVRLAALAAGGALAGLGGAYLSLVQTPFWVEKLTAGRGWIALALVVFATWRPMRLVVGAYLFGGITILQLHAQGLGLNVDAQLLSMLPYIATIAVLVAMSRGQWTTQLNAPACLGKVFYVSA